MHKENFEYVDGKKYTLAGHVPDSGSDASDRYQKISENRQRLLETDSEKEDDEFLIQVYTF